MIKSYICLCGNEFNETVIENETACMKIDPPDFCEHRFCVKSSFVVFKVIEGLLNIF